MFSTVADSFLCFPYLHFPPLHIRTYVFHTCIFHPPVLSFSVLAFSVAPKLPLISPEILRCPYLPTCQPNGATNENGKIFFQKMYNRPTFLSKKYASFPLPVLEEAWQTCCTSFMQSVACFTIICQMAPLPSGLSIAVQNDIIAAIQLEFMLCLYLMFVRVVCRYDGVVLFVQMCVIMLFCCRSGNNIL